MGSIFKKYSGRISKAKIVLYLLIIAVGFGLFGSSEVRNISLLIGSCILFCYATVSDGKRRY